MPLSYRKRIYRRAKGILWGPTEVIAAVVGLAVVLSRPVMDYLLRLWEGLPWWVGAFILCGLLLYAFARATYEEYREIEQERDALQERVKELQDRTITPQPGELKELCLHLSEELDDFVAHCQATSESWRFFEESRNAKTKEERDRAKVEEWRAMPRDEARMRELYHERYRERAVAVYEVLAQRAWLGPDKRHYFEEPKGDIYIQQVARLLEDVGNKLPDDKP